MNSDITAGIQRITLILDSSWARCCVRTMVDMVKGQAVAGVCYACTLRASAAAGHREAAWQVRVSAGSAGFL